MDKTTKIDIDKPCPQNPKTPKPQNPMIDLILIRKLQKDKRTNSYDDVAAPVYGKNGGMKNLNCGWPDTVWKNILRPDLDIIGEREWKRSRIG